MRRLFGWMAGLAGVAALARLLSRRRPSTRGTTLEEDPAEALRRKLADSKLAETGATSAPGDEQPAAGDDAPSTSLEERRARLHEKAQEAIDAMRGENE